MTKENKKNTGSVYTPDFIVKSILDLSGYNGKNILKKHVIDNSCGDGAFLKAIVTRYCTEALKAGMTGDQISDDLKTYIHGIELNESERAKCISDVTTIANAFGADFVTWDIKCGNTLLIHDYDGMMDFVIGNPPYVRIHNIQNGLSEVKSFSFAQGGMTDLFIVFYEIGIRMLKPNGVLGYITPSSFFNSVAGDFMRKFIVYHNLLKKVVDLKHAQVFDAMTYTTIIIMQRGDCVDKVEYYEFDETTSNPEYIDALTQKDYYIDGSFYFASREELTILQRVNNNINRADIQVKNGFATLCDSVFICPDDFNGNLVIPVIKASKGVIQKMIFPYNANGKLISEANLKQDPMAYERLLSNKDKLMKRSSEKLDEEYWYAFGRSQAISDVYKDKLTINTLIRDEHDLKLVNAPAGTGVYSGLYITSNTIHVSKIKEALRTKEFAKYVALLAKYKSGGYYTYSSKDVKKFLDYKLGDKGDCIYA